MGNSAWEVETLPAVYRVRFLNPNRLSGFRPHLICFRNKLTSRLYPRALLYDATTQPRIRETVTYVCVPRRRR